MLSIDPKDDVVTSSDMQRDFKGVVQAVAGGRWKFITSGPATIALVPFAELQDMMRAREELDALRLVAIANEAQARAARGESLDIQGVLDELDASQQKRYGVPTPELTEANIAAYLDT